MVYHELVYLPEILDATEARSGIRRHEILRRRLCALQTVRDMVETTVEERTITSSK